MAWTIRYSPEAARAIRKLDPGIRARVRRAIATLREDPLRGKPLQLDLKGLRSWRTGDFRLVYRAVEQRLEVIMVALGHRRDVYDRLRRRRRPVRRRGLSAEELLRRWRSLPAIDPEALRRDIDRFVDPAPAPTTP